MTEARVIIAGGRDFSDYALLERRCDRILQNIAATHKIIIVSGCAPGADTLGEKYALHRGYSVAKYPAEWKKLGKAAGFVRNRTMAQNGDYLIAFWDGSSRGTKNMIQLAHEHALKVRVVSY